MLSTLARWQMAEARGRDVRVYWLLGSLVPICRKLAFVMLKGLPLAVLPPSRHKVVHHRAAKLRTTMEEIQLITSANVVVVKTGVRMLDKVDQLCNSATASLRSRLTAKRFCTGIRERPCTPL